MEINKSNVTRFLMATAVGIGAFISHAAPARADDSHCPDFYVCAWTHQDFQGNKQLGGTSYEGYWALVDEAGRDYHSLKNRFENRKVLTVKAGDWSTQRCTPPGGERRQPPAFNFVYVGYANSHC